jgi:hypothetical protein
MVSFNYLVSAFVVFGLHAVSAKWIKVNADNIQCDSEQKTCTVPVDGSVYFQWSSNWGIYSQMGSSVNSGDPAQMFSAPQGASPPAQ